MVKAYLSRKGIQFTERNVSTDTQALQDLVSLGYRTTPVTVINKENVVDYNLNKLDIALGHGVP